MLSPNTDATVDFPEGSIRVGPVRDVINVAGEYAVFVDDHGRIRFITAPSHELESPAVSPPVKVLGRVAGAPDSATS